MLFLSTAGWHDTLSLIGPRILEGYDQILEPRWSSLSCRRIASESEPRFSAAPLNRFSRNTYKQRKANSLSSPLTTLCPQHFITMPGITSYPPFPDDVPTHPLLVVDYQLLKAGNRDEVARLWHAATHLGFW